MPKSRVNKQNRKSQINHLKMKKWKEVNNKMKQKHLNILKILKIKKLKIRINKQSQWSPIYNQLQKILNMMNNSQRQEMTKWRINKMKQN